jgi:hypothetical protein
MTKYELSLARDYVPGWTLVDAVRELFQNALDQEATVEGNTMFFEYYEEEQTLHIGNKLSVLDTKSLLLGASTKANDENTIGQFGEGYKVATLVLTRLGNTVKFFNYGAREVWAPRFVKSRRYGADVLTFFVDRKFPWTAVPNNNLTITIDNVTVDDYEEILASNLHIAPPHQYLETEYGRILLDEELKSKVFVNGLYVCDYDAYEYGYDFKPKHLRLDRDRKMANPFDLRWMASKMWLNQFNEEIAELAAELFEKGAADVEYVQTVASYSDTSKVNRLATASHRKFVEQHGPKAVPVSSQEDAEGLSPEHKPVIVKEEHKKLITASPDYEEPTRDVPPSLSERVREWMLKYDDMLSVDATVELERILWEEEE